MPSSGLESALRPVVQEAVAALQDPACTQRLYDAARQLWSWCELHPYEEQFGPSLTSQLIALCSALGNAAGPHCSQQTRSSTAFCWVLYSVLAFVESGAAELPCSDLVRALTATAVPLNLLPRLLAHPELLPADGPRASDLVLLVECASDALNILIRLSAAPSPLPPGALRIIETAHLKADALLGFLEAVAHYAAHICKHAAGSNRPLAVFCALLRPLLAPTDGRFAGVGAAVRQQPQLQRQLVALAARSYAAPGAGQPWEATLRMSTYAAVLAADCLEDARWEHEAAAGEDGSLLNLSAAVTLEGSRALARGSDAEADAHAPLAAATLQLRSLELGAALLRDVVGAEHGSGSSLPPAIVRRLLAHLGTCAPALAELAAAVAGAPPCAGAAETGLQQLGWLCWADFRADWAAVLRAWMRAVHCLCNLDSLHRQLCSPDCCAPAALAAAALLRLAPLLPLQPGDLQRGSSATAPAVVAAEGGEVAAKASLARPDDLAACSLGAVCALLSFALPPLAGRLLQWSARAVRSGQLGARAGLYAFDAFSAACRYVHMAAGPRSGAAAPLFLDPEGGALDAVLVPGVAAEPAALAPGRLECLLLLYLRTLAPLPPSSSPDASEIARFLSQKRCSTLAALLGQPGLGAFWGQLLSPATAGAAAVRVGTAPTVLLAAAASDCLQAALQVLETTPLSDEGSGVHIAVEVLERAAACSPAASLRAIAADGELMSALCKSCCRLWAEFHWAAPHRQKAHRLFGRVRDLLCSLVREVLPDAASRPLLNQLARQPGHDRQAVADVFSVLLEDVRAASERASAVREPPQPDAQAAGELAVRCARALALRNCANPCCANLAASGAGVRGKRCSGCRLVRYCSEACSRADWRAHKLACRLLRQEAGQGQGQA